MPVPDRLKAIFSFGRKPCHFPVPATSTPSAARGGGPGRRAAPARMRLSLEGRRDRGRLICPSGRRLLVCASFAFSVSSMPAAGASADLAPDRVRIGTAVADAARSSGLSERWIWAVMQAESGLDAGAVSPRGAMGLMQLMPATWAALRSDLGLGRDPFDVRDNVLAGAVYLQRLLQRYGPYGMLAAYNAGPGRYEQHLLTGRPLPAETQAYVLRVQRRLAASPQAIAAPDFAAHAPGWQSAPIFVSRTPTDRSSAPGSAASHSEAVGDPAEQTP